MLHLAAVGQRISFLATDLRPISRSGRYGQHDCLPLVMFTSLWNECLLKCVYVCALCIHVVYSMLFIILVE